jgi:hypothetical protein
MEGVVVMDFIIEFIFQLFKSKKPTDPEYNNSVNTLIFILLYFSAIIAFLWLCSKLGLFG